MPGVQGRTQGSPLQRPRLTLSRPGLSSKRVCPIHAPKTRRAWLLLPPGSAKSGRSANPSNSTTVQRAGPFNPFRGGQVRRLNVREPNGSDSCKAQTSFWLSLRYDQGRSLCV